MAIVSNVNRRAAAKAIVEQVKALRLVIGLTIQTHRAYESPGRQSQGLTQQQVAAQANTQQPIVSQLENGGNIPNDQILQAILTASGFDMSADGGGRALLNLLSAIRDNVDQLSNIIEEKPG